MDQAFIFEIKYCAALHQKNVLLVINKIPLINNTGKNFKKTKYKKLFTFHYIQVLTKMSNLKLVVTFST